MADAIAPRDAVRVSGDRTKCWRWAAIWISFATILVPILSVSAASAYSSTGALTAVAVAIWSLVVVLGSLHAFWWYQGPGSTEYVCDGVTLRAERRGKVLREVRCDEVQALAISHGLSWLNISLTESFPPSIPYLKLLLRESPRGTKGLNFPPILIWGDEAAVAASDELSSAVGLGR